MEKRRRSLIIKGLAMALCLIPLICPLRTVAKADPRYPVTVSILPQRYFVERIGGERVTVTVMVLPGANPATYEPRPSQLVALSKSSAYFTIGVPFERVWLKRVARINPKMQIVRTGRGIERRMMETLEDVLADKGPPWAGGSAVEKRKEEVSPDPHVWTSPPLVMLLGRNILMALSYFDPSHRDEYEENFERFQMEIVRLDREIRNMFSGIGKRNRFMVSHPAWGYFADAYGLRQIPVEIEGKEPKPGQLQAIIQYAKGLGIKRIFAQPQFSAKSPELIARAIGGKVSFADPLALEWARNLKQVAQQIRPALR